MQEGIFRFRGNVEHFTLLVEFECVYSEVHVSQVGALKPIEEGQSLHTGTLYSAGLID